jgi:hypothetical protein
MPFRGSESRSGETRIVNEGIMHRLLEVCLLASAMTTSTLSAQESVPWHDPSKHTVQFVTVEEGIRIEVLDWGGTGRPVVLLAGSGNTAHDAGLALPLIPIRVTTNNGWPTTCSKSSTRQNLLRLFWLVTPCLARN